MTTRIDFQPGPGFKLPAQTVEKLSDVEYERYTGKKRKKLLVKPTAPLEKEPTIYTSEQIQEKGVTIPKGWQIKVRREVLPGQLWRMEDGRRVPPEPAYVFDLISPEGEEMTIDEYNKRQSEYFQKEEVQRDYIPPEYLVPPPYEYKEGLIETISDVFPDIDPNIVMLEAIEDVNSFLDSILRKGKTEDTFGGW